MTDSQFAVIAALLAAALYQLTALRREQRLARLDDLARHMCPNIYEVSTRTDLRDWIVRLASTDRILTRDRSWADVHERWLSRGHRCELSRTLSRDEREQLLKPAWETTIQFFRTAQASTRLTKHEIDYLAYRAWRYAFARDYMGDITNSGVKMSVEDVLDEEVLVERYAKLER